MSAMTWLIIAIVGFSLSGITLVAAVIMFIKMNIPAIIGDLTGKSVAREIEAMRKANAASGGKLHKSSRVNVDRGQLTEKVSDEAVGGAAKAVAHASKRLDKTEAGTSAHLNQTETESGELSTQRGVRTTESLSINVEEVDIEERRATTVLTQNRTTDVLGEGRATEVLSEARQTEVLSEARQTEVLSEARQTEVLSEVRQTEVLSEIRQTEVLVPPAAANVSDGTAVLDEDEFECRKIKPVAFRVVRSVVKIHTDEVVE